MTDPGCYFHGEEPIPEDCYILCGECWHAWTVESLLEEHNKILSHYGVTEENPENIFSCPLCTHDF